MQIQGGSRSTPKPLTLNNTSVVLENVSGTNTWAGTVALAANSTITTDASSVLNVSGVISGAGGFTTDGAGTLNLPSGTANTYTGATTINAGIVNIANAASLGGTGNGTTVNAATCRCKAASRWPSR